MRSISTTSPPATSVGSVGRGRAGVCRGKGSVTAIPIFEEIKTKKDVTYREAVYHAGEMQELLLDVHEPAGDDAALRAAEVWVPGGFFIRGSKNSESYRTVWTYFTKAGFVTFAINYRLQDPETLSEGAGPAVIGLEPPMLMTQGPMDDVVAFTPFNRAPALALLNIAVTGLIMSRRCVTGP